MTAIESPAVRAEAVRGPVRAVVVAGGACWSVGVVQYAVAQLVAAAAWSRPYSLKINYFSDWGTPRAGCSMSRTGRPTTCAHPTMA